MTWQDIVITSASIVFSISLIPQVYHGFVHKVATITYKTSVPTTLGLFAISGTYVTLHLYFSALVSFCTALLWALFILQTAKYGPSSREHK